MNQAPPQSATETRARRAEELAARFPPLMVAAERVAATVVQGVHGRRRVGQGDSFWQFRPFLPGDSLSHVSWRASAKSDRLYIRENEWEAAQSVFLWCDGSASMRWRSTNALPEKFERAELLLLALAALLLRGGERVALLGAGQRPMGGRGMLDRIAMALAKQSGAGLPAEAPLPRHARVVLIGDFLGPLDDIQRAVARLAQRTPDGHMLQVLDPAEETLPYAGRVRFEGLEQEGTTLLPRVEGVRAEYEQRLAAHREGLAGIAATAGWRFATHRTSETPQAALLNLYTALAARL
ncbi:MAG: DUF58 domain-containing protein [Alphaproteobacteria bacterium]|nr:DUF58 domain-containing protein [Alphaproteobacteria bacterium]